MSAEQDYVPFFPKERREERGGLIVIREKMTPEMSKQRREDNNTIRKMKKARKTTRGPETWMATAKAKKKAKRNAQS